MSKRKARRLSISQMAEKALKAAVRHVIEDHYRTGDPLIVWQNGKVARISAKSLVRRKGGGHEPERD